MAIQWDNDGNGVTYQGDSGYLNVEGLTPGADYTIYLAIQNSKRRIVGAEQYVVSGGLDTVRIFISPDLTNKCTVPITSDYEDYFYFLKACKEDENGNQIEDTLFINGATFGDKKTLRVYPKGAEGYVNG